MKQSLVRLAAITFLALILGACSKPQTPQEVAEAFWHAVVEEDTDHIVTYSTLTDAESYDHFGQDWKGLMPAWGKVVIEAGEASVVTSMQNTKTGEKLPSFDTFLVKDGEVWKVDYQRTGRSVNGGIVGELLGAFKKFGQQFSSQLANSAGAFHEQMNGLMDELGKLGDSIDQQAADTIARYGEVLRSQLDAMSRSIEKALEEQGARVSTGDREALTTLRGDLKGSSDDLAEPDLDAFVRTGELAVAVRQKLATLDDRIFAPYQQQWQQWGRRIEADMRDLLGELKRVAHQAGSHD